MHDTKCKMNNNNEIKFWYNKHSLPRDKKVCTPDCSKG